ncbi:Uncharacterised protein g9249 [Pycnogonum litorale]
MMNLSDEKANEMRTVNREHIGCVQKIERDRQDGVETGEYCPTEWHSVMCWNRTKVNSVSFQRCPRYVSNFKNKEGYAVMKCGADGSWQTTNSTIAPYVSCLQVNELFVSS